MAPAVVCGTGFNSWERAWLQSLAAQLLPHVVLETDLVANHTTHLVCRSVLCAVNTLKYTRALQWGVKVVSWKWLVDSAAEGRVLPASAAYKTDPCAPFPCPPEPGRGRPAAAPTDITNAQHAARNRPVACKEHGEQPVVKHQRAQQASQAESFSFPTPPLLRGATAQATTLPSSQGTPDAWRGAVTSAVPCKGVAALSGTAVPCEATAGPHHASAAADAGSSLVQQPSNADPPPPEELPEAIIIPGTQAEPMLEDDWMEDVNDGGVDNEGAAGCTAAVTAERGDSCGAMCMQASPAPTFSRHHQHATSAVGYAGGEQHGGQPGGMLAQPTPSTCGLTSVTPGTLDIAAPTDEQLEAAMQVSPAAGLQRHGWVPYRRQHAAQPHCDAVISLARAAATTNPGNTAEPPMLHRLSLALEGCENRSAQGHDGRCPPSGMPLGGSGQVGEGTLVAHSGDTDDNIVGGSGGDGDEYEGTAMDLSPLRDGLPLVPYMQAEGKCVNDGRQQPAAASRDSSGERSSVLYSGFGSLLGAEGGRSSGSGVSSEPAMQADRVMQARGSGGIELPPTSTAAAEVDAGNLNTHDITHGSSGGGCSGGGSSLHAPLPSSDNSHITRRRPRAAPHDPATADQLTLASSGGNGRGGGGGGGDAGLLTPLTWGAAIGAATAVAAAAEAGATAAAGGQRGSLALPQPSFPSTSVTQGVSATTTTAAAPTGCSAVQHALGATHHHHHLHPREPPTSTAGTIWHVAAQSSPSQLLLQSPAPPTNHHNTDNAPAPGSNTSPTAAAGSPCCLSAGTAEPSLRDGIGAHDGSTPQVLHPPACPRAVSPPGCTTGGCDMTNAAVVHRRRLQPPPSQQQQPLGVAAATRTPVSNVTATTTSSGPSQHLIARAGVALGAYDNNTIGGTGGAGAALLTATSAAAPQQHVPHRTHSLCMPQPKPLPATATTAAAKRFAGVLIKPEPVANTGSMGVMSAMPDWAMEPAYELGSRDGGGGVGGGLGEVSGTGALSLRRALMSGSAGVVTRPSQVLPVAMEEAEGGDDPLSRAAAALSARPGLHHIVGESDDLCGDGGGDGEAEEGDGGGMGGDTAAHTALPRTAAVVPLHQHQHQQQQEQEQTAGLRGVVVKCEPGLERSSSLQQRDCGHVTATGNVSAATVSGAAANKARAPSASSTTSGSARSRAAPGAAAGLPAAPVVDVVGALGSQLLPALWASQQHQKQLQGRSNEQAGVSVGVLKPLARAPRSSTVKQAHQLATLAMLSFAEQVKLKSCWLPSEGVVLTARDRAKRIMCPLVRRQPPPSAITAAAAGSSSPAATASPGLDKQAWLIAEPVVFYCMPDGCWWMEYRQLFTWEAASTRAAAAAATVGAGAGATPLQPPTGSLPFHPQLQLLRDVCRQHCRLSDVQCMVAVSRSNRGLIRAAAAKNTTLPSREQLAALGSACDGDVSGGGGAAAVAACIAAAVELYQLHEFDSSSGKLVGDDEDMMAAPGGQETSM